MTFVTAGLGVEQFPTAFGRVADGTGVSCNEMIIGRIEGNQRPFVGGNGAQHILLVRASAEGLHEAALIVLVTCDPRYSIGDTGRAHLEGVGDRHRRLLLEAIDPAVPELMSVIECIQNRWRVTLTGAAVDANGGGPAIGEGAGRIVAGGAGDSAIT